MTKDVIISVYKEEITWLKMRRFNNEKIFAYKKFERFDYDFVKLLPNIGRESHTYVNHILENYNNEISEYSMFLQGDPFPHLIKNNDSISYMIFKNEFIPTHLFYPLGNVVDCDSFGQPFSVWKCELYTIWDELFGTDMPHNFLANYGAQQIVHKSLIKNRSKKFWEKAMELHYEHEHCPWAFEILWTYIFDPRFVSRI